jgi:hypothetical protein
MLLLLSFLGPYGIPLIIPAADRLEDHEARRSKIRLERGRNEFAQDKSGDG